MIYWRYRANVKMMSERIKRYDDDEQNAGIKTGKETDRSNTKDKNKDVDKIFEFDNSLQVATERN